MRLYPRACLLFFTLLAGLVGTPLVGTAEPAGEFIKSLPRPAELPDEEVVKTVAYSLVARSWTLQEQSEDTVIGHLVHRGYDATVTFVIRTDSVDMHCEGWRVKKKTGARIKPAQPTGWLKNLEKDIGKRLSLAALE